MKTPSEISVEQLDVDNVPVDADTRTDEPQDTRRFGKPCPRRVDGR